MPKSQEGIPFMFRIRVLLGVVMELIRKNLGMFLLVAGFFTLGYSTRNWEDAQDRRIAADTLNAQRRELQLSCDLRVGQEIKHGQERMEERDQLLADQSARLKEQGLLIQTIADRQAQNSKYTNKELATIKAAANSANSNAVAARVNSAAAAKGATEAKDVVNKVAKNVVTDRDRQQINKAVKENK